MHNDRLNKLRSQMAARKIDAVLVTYMPNVFYLSGFTGSTAAVVVTEESSYILVDPRYSIQAREECKGTEVRDYTSGPTISAAGKLINELKPTTCGFEAGDLTVASHRLLRRTVDERIKLRSTSGLVERLRAVKDSHEIELIRRACEIVDNTFTTITREIRPGLREKDVALTIDFTMRKLGADEVGFETIAATGANSACPHHSPTNAILQFGDLLKMDYGATLDHYNADITRTICLGKPDDKQREIYQIVLDAQIRAIEAIAPGKTGREIDAVARDYITSKGYGENFGHSLGHALGIEVHDGPAFSKSSDIVLEPGMVTTVEPGIYIEGWGGIRIEDDVLVTETGYEILTSATKEFIGI